MRHRRLVPLLAAVSIAVLAGAGCGASAAAIQVDDESLSRGDFEDQLDEVYENDAFRGVLFGQVDQQQLRGEDDPHGSYTQEYVAAMAFVQIQFMVIPQVLDDEGLEVTDSDRRNLVQQIEQSAPGALDDLPDGMRDDYVEGFAGFDKLRSEFAEDEFNTVLTEAIEAADIDVSSRYGSWNPDEFAVEPPPGPRPASGSGDGSGSGNPADGSDLPAG